MKYPFYMLLAATVTATSLNSPGQETTMLNPNQTLAREILRELIGINTTVNMGRIKAVMYRFIKVLASVL
jgi:hypothetical protein